MSINTAWFRNRLADSGISQRQLAKKLDLQPAAITLMLQGKRPMRMIEAAEIARLLGLPVSEVMQQAGISMIASGMQAVPVVGFLDGAGELHISPPNNERVQAPKLMPENTQAVQCRTGMSPIEYMDGWTLYFSKPNGMSTEALNRYCALKLKGGIALVGYIKRGYTAGKYNIYGPVTIQDAEIEWASPILLINP